jgi:hypothetical protein
MGRTQCDFITDNDTRKNIHCNYEDSLYVRTRLDNNSDMSSIHVKHADTHTTVAQYEST